MLIYWIISLWKRFKLWVAGYSTWSMCSLGQHRWDMPGGHCEKCGICDEFFGKHKADINRCPPRYFGSCQAGLTGLNCDRNAEWEVTSDYFSPHLCCDRCKELLEEREFEGFTALQLPRHER